VTNDFINKETGEIIEDVVKVVTRKQDEQLKRIFQTSEDNKIFNEENGGFIFKEDSKRVDNLESKLTDSDIIKALYLATYLDYDSYLKYDTGKIMTKLDIKKVICVNKNIFGTWYNKMLRLKIITEDDKGVHMNKGYYIKGAIGKRKDYNRMFVDGTRQIYEDNKNSNQSMIGNIIRLLPYVNAYTNVLCWNPLESDETKIEPITIGELAKGLGYNGDEKRLMNAMSKIRVFDSHPLVLFFNDNEIRSESYLMFHPKICYSGKNNKMDEVYKMFVMMANKHKDKNGLLKDGDSGKRLIRRD
jgi:hypothetical protein